MAVKTNSFLEYLQTDRFYSRIRSAIFGWCVNNKDDIIPFLDGHDIRRIANIDDIELNYKTIWIESKQNTNIEFDISIEVEITAEGVSGKYRDREEYSGSIWVTVCCKGSLSNKLNDFKILDVQKFYKNRPTKPLSGELIPYMSKSNYDDYANEILEKYYYIFYPEARNEPVPINVEKLASNMGLSIVNATITEDKTIFGQIYFKEAEAKIFNEDKREYEFLLVKKDTMLVDNRATYLRSFGSRNLTVAHECVHAYYHRKTFLFAQMINSDINFVQCNVNGTLKNNGNLTVLDWMEIQANALAPCILMPKESFTAYANNLFDNYSQTGVFGKNTINEIVEKLANTYKVTIYAAKKRLIDLGFELALGAFNWIDGHYVRPYSFKKGALRINETYTISYKDIYKKVIENPSISALVMTGKFIFVENHLCIDHSDYIEYNNEGELILSDYALNNMDECCVKFSYKSTRGFNGGSDYGLMCYLSRDMSKELEFDLEIAKNPALTTIDENFNKRYSIHNNNVDEVIKAIAFLSFGETLEFLMKFLDISIQELEFDSGLNERTIRRYLNGENKSPDKRTVVALLWALNLPPRISNIAIGRAGIVFIQGNNEDTALLNILLLYREAPRKYINKFLVDLGFSPLTRE